MATGTFNIKNHPNRQPGEVFIGNTNNYGFRHIGWKTKREEKGGKTLYSFGGEYTDKTYFPVFASEEEIKVHNYDLWLRLRYVEPTK